ncbi:hypothetical protein [Kineococcus esterisolvens]|uniref:hypothetical protein n=1 Tax=unclassified Kineococcus TaxID=2621656 RepID=UPI003D7C3930
MRRFLIVANQSLNTQRVEQAIRERAEGGECEFYVVVPATPLREQVVGPGDRAADLSLTLPERSFALAQQRLDDALARIGTLGVTVGGEVGEVDVVDAARSALSRFSADEIVVSTLPSGLSRWLRADAPSRIARATGLPVTHVAAEPARH